MVIQLYPSLITVFRIHNHSTYYLNNNTLRHLTQLLYGVKDYMDSGSGLRLKASQNIQFLFRAAQAGVPQEVFTLIMEPFLALSF